MNTPKKFKIQNSKFKIPSERGFTPHTNSGKLLGGTGSFSKTTSLPAFISPMRSKSMVWGFTLIELIIYLAIVGVVLTVSGAIGFNVFSQRAAMTASEEVGQNARLAIEKISLAIRNSEAINTPTPGASSSVLSLRTDSPATNPTVFSFSSGALWLQLGGSAPATLTSSETEVVVFQTKNVSYPDTIGTIKATLQLRAYNPEHRPEYEKEQTYEFTESARRK